MLMSIDESDAAGSWVILVFDANGGHFEDGTTEHTIEADTVSPISVYDAPVMEGKEFLGWLICESYGQAPTWDDVYQPGDSVKINDPNTIAIAQWDPDFLHLGNATSNGSTSSENAVYDSLQIDFSQNRGVQRTYHILPGTQIDLEFSRIMSSEGSLPGVAVSGDTVVGVPSGVGTLVIEYEGTYTVGTVTIVVLTNEVLEFVSDPIQDGEVAYV